MRLWTSTEKKFILDHCKECSLEELQKYIMSKFGKHTTVDQIRSLIYRETKTPRSSYGYDVKYINEVDEVIHRSRHKRWKSAMKTVAEYLHKNPEHYVIIKCLDIPYELIYIWDEENGVELDNVQEC